VVEDEPSIRELVHDGLGAKGLEVECVGSGDEAVAVVLRRAASGQAAAVYDVILCDLKMPGMSGEQVFEKLKMRPDGSPQPFVFMTGDLADAGTLEFLQNNQARSISKPFKVSDLMNALKESLSTRADAAARSTGSAQAEAPLPPITTSKDAETRKRQQSK
jgi:CheY-like chemotaxis protein